MKIQKRRVQKNEQTITQIDAIDNYLRMDIQQSKTKQELNKLAKLKIEIYKEMLKQYDTIKHFENDNSKYQEQVSTCEKQCELLVTAYPIKQNKHLSIFLRSELSGNLFEARSLMKKYQQGNDLSNQLQHQKLIINIFDQSVYSMTISFGEIFGKLLKYDQRLPGLLGFTLEEFEAFKDVRDIIPPLLARYHNDWINYMFEKEDNRILHKFRKILCKNNSNICVPIEVFIEQNIYCLNELPFEVFIRPIKNSTPFLLVTSTLAIVGLNQQFLNQVQLSHLKKLPFELKISIDQIIPEYSTFIEQFNDNKKLFALDIFDADLFFPDPSDPFITHYLIPDLQASTMKDQ